MENPCGVKPVGAGKRNRTPDLLITNELLYQLSYSGFYLKIIKGGSVLSTLVVVGHAVDFAF